MVRIHSVQCALVAQLVEQAARNGQVVGSMPTEGLMTDWEKEIDYYRRMPAPCPEHEHREAHEHEGDCWRCEAFMRYVRSHE